MAPLSITSSGIKVHYKVIVQIYFKVNTAIIKRCLTVQFISWHCC